MHALFDADILVFRCGFAAERAKWFLRIGDDTHQFDYKREADVALDELLPGKYSREEGKDYELWSERFVEPVEHALHNVKTIVNKTLEDLGLSVWDVTMYLSGPSEENFRVSVAKSRPYKGNRDKAHRPTHEGAIKDYIIGNYQHVVSSGQEADDEMGIAQCRLGPTASVIVTQDKDLDMIPGLKYDFVEGIGYSVTEEQAYRNFCMQLLMGDPTDNIPGLPKIGKAKAKRALEGSEPDEWMDIVMQMYQAHSPEPDWYAYLREQGQLVWIRRQPEEVWEPPELEASVFEESEASMY